MVNHIQTVPIIKQDTKFGCGTACARAFSQYFGKTITTREFNQELEKIGKRKRFGISMLDIKTVLATNKINTIGLHAIDEFLYANCKPVIAHLKFGPFKHFVVVTNANKNKIRFMDPGRGKMVTVSTRIFSFFWTKKLLVIHE